MNIQIHKAWAIIPEAGDTVLLADRVHAAFTETFESKKQERGVLHLAFENRYFIVFWSLEEARDFCTKKLAAHINNPQESGARIEFRGIVENTESKECFCVINIIFPNPQLSSEYLQQLSEELFSG